MTPPISGMPTRRSAESYLARGWMPIPVPHRSKNPGYKDWELTRLRPEDIPARFDGQPQNIGVLLGEPSHWLIDVDLDHPRCIELADQFLPPTPAMFGRPGKPRSHRIYVVTGPAATKKHKSRSAGMLVELRSTGMQTIFPPSTHESGEPIAWESEGAEPAVVSPDELLAAVERLANAVRIELGEKAAPKPPKPAAKGRDGGHQAAPVGPRGNKAARVERYAAQALRLELDAVNNATPGSRNDTLNTAAYNLGTLVGAGALDRATAEAELADAAATAGLEPGETTTTIRSGLDAGEKQPRQLPDFRAPVQSTVKQKAQLRTDLGNSFRFVAALGDDLRYCGPRGQLLLWAGRQWRPDESHQVMKHAKDVALGIFDEARDEPDPAKQKALSGWAIKSQTRDRLAAMVDLARCELPIAPEQLDADAFLFNVENGTLDLRTGKLLAHERSHYITKLAPVRFDPAAECPLWIKFLNRIFANNAALLDYVQRLAGMCLTADISEQCLWLFHGGGANGKSVLLDTFAGMMGDYAGEAPPDLLLVRSQPEHPCEIADLCGRRLVMASEADEGRRLRVQLVKRLTGNARLKGRFMRGNFFEFPRTHKLILATNNRPVIKENTVAIWRRIKLVPFDVTIPPDEQDRGLTSKLKTEYSGILNWAVQGCLAWRRDGLTAPAEVQAATASYREEQDLLAEFFDECCVFNPASEVLRNDLFAAYSAWANRTKEAHPLDQTAFYERVRLRPGVGEPRRRLNGKARRFFSGIGLANSELFQHDA